MIMFLTKNARMLKRLGHCFNARKSEMPLEITGDKRQCLHPEQVFDSSAVCLCILVAFSDRPEKDVMEVSETMTRFY
jgi:hypothetical protein